MKKEKYENKTNYDAMNPKITRYINVHTSYNFCNMRCSYCYIRQTDNFKEKESLYPAPEKVAEALSKERWGGVCFINFCAAGETLLDRDILPVLDALIKEGHYLQVVTNGTITEAFNEMLRMGMDVSRILFKFSFHYEQLLEHGLLETYFSNIRKMRRAGASITLELVPDDSLIDKIEEIKNVSMENLGALPHLTVPRDSSKKNLPVLTDLSEAEYIKIWGQFESEMFNVKMQHYNVKRSEHCWAGRYSFWLDLVSGELYKCCKFCKIGNIYEDTESEIVFKEIGNQCQAPYCYNGHIYFPFGIVDGVETVTYDVIRDRKTVDGSHWITKEMRDIISQRFVK